MKRWRYGILAMVFAGAAAGGGYWLQSGNPNVLRHFVIDQCVPHQQQNNNPAPCQSVNLRGGYVLFLSLIHISEPTRQCCTSRMPSSA